MVIENSEFASSDEDSDGEEKEMLVAGKHPFFYSVLFIIRGTRSWRVGGDFASKTAQTYIILLGVVWSERTIENIKNLQYKNFMQLWNHK